MGSIQAASQDQPGRDQTSPPSPGRGGAGLPAAAEADAAVAAYVADDRMWPWWLRDGVWPGDEVDHAAWLAGLPSEVRAEYQQGPYTGDGESIPPGFSHHDNTGHHGCGFASGGANDTQLPGPGLAHALQAAAGVPLAGGGGHAGLGESELIGVLCGWRKLISWAQAGEAAAAHALVRRRIEQARDPKLRSRAEHCGDEVAAALGLSAVQAGRLVEVAAGLARLPEVHAALEAGQLDYPKACAFVDLLAGLSDENAREIAHKLLAGWSAGAGLTSGKLRRWLDRAVLDADPGAAQKRQEEGRQLTRVDSWPEQSGNGVIAGRELPAADVIAIDKQLTVTAEWLQSAGAVGTIRELRAATFTALLAGRELATLLPSPADPPTSPVGTEPTDPSGTDNGSTQDDAFGVGANRDDSGESAGWPRLAGTVNLIMPLATWAGLARLSGEVAGYGVTDSATSSSLAAMMGQDSRWCLTLTDDEERPVAHACARAGPPSGPAAIGWATGLRSNLQCLGHGDCGHARQSGGYVPPGSLRHVVTIRQRTCAFPGCARAATRCDLDHTLAYDQGGRTCECNLAPLCRRHHRAKQAAGWHLEQPQPGHMTWHLPHQRSYQTTGEPYPV